MTRFYSLQFVFIFVCKCVCLCELMCIPCVQVLSEQNVSAPLVLKIDSCKPSRCWEQNPHPLQEQKNVLNC